MSRRSSSLPSPAMAVALVALFVALGGTGYAATHLGTPAATARARPKPKPKPPDDSAADKTLFNRLAATATVAKAKTANFATTAASAAAASTATTAGNAKNLGGMPASAFQPTANVMFANINTGVSPTIVSGRGATGVTNLDANGEYAVTFDQPIGNCTFVATPGHASNTAADAVIAVVRTRNLTLHPNDVQVNLFTSFGDMEYIGQGFMLMVLCP